MSLLTPAQVRELYPTLVGTSEDLRLGALIDEFDALAAAYCGYPRPDSGPYTLASATYTLYLDHDGGDPRILRLPVRPVVSITSVNVDATWEHGADTAYSTSTDVTFDAREGVLLCKHGGTLNAWGVGVRANKVVLVAGYATAPAGLVSIAAAGVRDLLDRQKAGDKLSASAGGQFFSRAGGANHLLSDSVRAALDAGYTLWGTRAG